MLLKDQISCDNCEGTGLTWDKFECADCQGKGYIEIYVDSEGMTKCDDCGNEFEDGIHLPDMNKNICMSCADKLIEKVKQEKSK